MVSALDQRDSQVGCEGIHEAVTNEEEGPAKFFHEVVRQRGCWVTLIATFLLALGIGSVIGLVRTWRRLEALL
jgi:hypothetical protein